MTLTMLALIYLFLTMILASVAILLGDKSMKDREKLSPFECGFDPFKKARSPFSIRFFLTTVIFLIFDVELALLVPLGLLGKSSDTMLMNSTTMILVTVIILGLLHEWNQGALKWIY